MRRRLELRYDIHGGVCADYAEESSFQEGCIEDYVEDEEDCSGFSYAEICSSCIDSILAE